MTCTVSLVAAEVTSELRRAVLRPQWPVGAAMPGDDDPAALHVAALEAGAVVGACVLLPNPYPGLPDEPTPWQLRGMATAAGRRGTGIGGRVLGGAVDAVGTRGGTLLWCKARVTAVTFYERHGFVLDTEQYVEPQTGLPHHDMLRRL